MKIEVLKKIMLVSVVSCGVLFASAVETEMGVTIGLVATKNSDGSKFENPTFGLTYQNNTYVLMPRFDLEYVSIKDDKADGLIKASLNGVYEFENQTSLSPYLLAGIGYENVQSGVENEFESHPFVHGGGGLNFSFENDFKINLEAKMLQIIGGEDEQNELIVTLGLRFPLSYSKPKVIHKLLPAPVIHVEPQIIQLAPEVISSIPQVMYINNNECSIKIDLPDLDRDGIDDNIDQCPATPCNFTVDNYGCPVKTTLKINFASSSSIIEYGSMSKVNDFAQFLLKNKGSMVKIVGHTDNIGTNTNNLSLSNKRAKAVMQALIIKGVSPARLTAEGKGELIPLATNDSIEGRAMNRRIEAELTYPRGRR